MTKQETKDYTPLTFIENARKYGFLKASDIDKSVLAERSPIMRTLIKFHYGGVEAVRDSNSYYDFVMSESKDTKRNLMEILRAPIRLLNLMGYPFGGALEALK